MIRLAFFGHNLNEPAVRKRAGAFMQAGCEVIGIMPHQGVAKSADFKWISLGETRDNDYAGRLRPLLKSFSLSRQAYPELGAVDLIYARNLDMLACAHAFARRNRQLEAMKTSWKGAGVKFSTRKCLLILFTLEKAINISF